MSVAAFDFFFVSPYLTFDVAEPQYLLSMGVMLLVAVTISTLTVRIKRQAEVAQGRERRTNTLYAMSREFASTVGTENLIRIAVDQISAEFHSHVGVMLQNPTGSLALDLLTDPVERLPDGP